MTIQEYQERNAEITKKIASLQSEVSGRESVATQYEQTAAQWRLNKTNPCKGTAKRKSACNEDNVYKENQALTNLSYAKSARDAAAQYKRDIQSLEAEFAANINRIAEAQKSADEVAKELANQGKTFESVKTEADYAGQAQIETQRVLATAEATAREKNAEADASNKKKIGYVVAGVGALVLIIIVVVLVKKFRKKK